MTNLKDAVNRGCNLLAVSITGLVGFAFVPEVFAEADMPDKVDDALLFLLGIGAVVWYARGRNRFARSVAPVVFVALAMIVKIGGLLVEIGDPASFGDDIGGLVMLVLATGLVVYQYGKVGQMAESA